MPHVSSHFVVASFVSRERFVTADHLSADPTPVI
jgi:hypothetical protein